MYFNIYYADKCTHAGSHPQSPRLNLRVHGFSLESLCGEVPAHSVQHISSGCCAAHHHSQSPQTFLHTACVIFLASVLCKPCSSLGSEAASRPKRKEYPILTVGPASGPRTITLAGAVVFHALHLADESHAFQLIYDKSHHLCEFVTSCTRRACDNGVIVARRSATTR